jgi:hypothetical protein
MSNGQNVKLNNTYGSAAFSGSFKPSYNLHSLDQHRLKRAHKYQRPRSFYSLFLTKKPL